MAKYKSWDQPKKPDFTHASDKRVVTSFSVINPEDAASLPKKLMLVMEGALECGVPVQVQFEIIPHAAVGWTVTVDDPQFPYAPGFYAYHCSIESVKARIKPGTDEFVGKEESNLNHVINGTEGSEEAEKRAEKRMQKIEEKDALNRFTGLEL